MISLADKTAIVTGGASGIRAASVRRFTAEGARVIIADRNAGAGTALARDCGGQFVSLDVSDPSSWNALHDAAVEAFDGIDILINSAGITRCGWIDHYHFVHCLTRRDPDQPCLFGQQKRRQHA